METAILQRNADANDVGPAHRTIMRSDKLKRSELADVAQLVEQSIRNRQVIGSSPIVGSIVSITCAYSHCAKNSVFPSAVSPCKSIVYF
jgi:uncharacterized protein YlxW (UPF0749 family)